MLADGLLRQRVDVLYREDGEELVAREEMDQLSRCRIRLVLECYFR